MKDSKKNTGSFFIPPKSSGQYLPENVQQLILLTKKNKARDLSNKLFHSNIYLPKSLQIEQLKKEILKTNNKLFLLSERNNFGRKFFENERYENDSFYNCFGTLNENEYLQYLIYSASKTDLKIDLPKFDLITDYLALIDYYDDLRFDFNEVENGRGIPNPETKYQLQTKLTDEQRSELFELLLSNKYIAPTTDKESFIWAFGGKIQPSNWQPIEWIDKSKTRHEHNMKTLYELLYLLGVDKDTSAKTPNNLYRKMEFCFDGLVNIAEKNPSKIEQDTERKRLLKTIIEEVEKVEAQK